MTADPARRGDSHRLVLDEPERVIAAMTAAGFTLEARLDRAPCPGAEHATQRCYLLARA